MHSAHRKPVWRSPHVAFAVAFAQLEIQLQDLSHGRSSGPGCSASISCFHSPRKEQIGADDTGPPGHVSGWSHIIPEASCRAGILAPILRHGAQRVKLSLEANENSSDVTAKYPILHSQRDPSDFATNPLNAGHGKHDSDSSAVTVPAGHRRHVPSGSKEALQPDGHG